MNIQVLPPCPAPAGRVFIVCLGLAGVSLTFAAPPPLLGEAFDCNGCQVLRYDELQSRRGGFEFAGLSFEFGANIRSFIDNRLVLESIVSITSEGSNHRQVTLLPTTTSIPDITSIQDAAPAATQTQTLDTVPVVYPMVQTVTPASPRIIQSRAEAAQVPATIDLSGLGNALGVSVNDRKGFTAALHEATRERIIGTIVNTASHRNLRQELEVTVNVRNFREFQQNARQNLLNSRFGEAVLR